MDLTNYKIDRSQLASAEELQNVDALAKTRGTSSTERLTITTFPLANEVISLRAGTSDAVVFYETFLGLYHIPPTLPPNIETVLDLGANIGLTAAHYAVLLPTCRVLAVEADPDCAALAVENTQPWRKRCTILNAAVWKDDRGVTFGTSRGQEYGGRIDGEGKQLQVASVTIDALIDGLGVAYVDFVKMDIEGCEELLIAQENGWARRVRSLLVELHGYPIRKCISDLRRLGFAAWKHKRHWASVFAIRRERRLPLRERLRFLLRNR
jgi:FkbM family methyltransferase